MYMSQNFKPNLLLRIEKQIYHLFQAIVSKAIGDTLTNTSELFTIHHTHSSAHCILNYIPLMTEKYR